MPLHFSSFYVIISPKYYLSYQLQTFTAYEVYLYDNNNYRFKPSLFSEPNGNVSLQDSSIKEEVSNIILDSYCGEYYINQKFRIRPPIIECTWEDFCSNGNAVISEWVFPDDALFLETPYFLFLLWQKLKKLQR